MCTDTYTLYIHSNMHIHRNLLLNPETSISFHTPYRNCQCWLRHIFSKLDIFLFLTSRCISRPSLAIVLCFFLDQRMSYAILASLPLSLFIITERSERNLFFLFGGLDVEPTYIYFLCQTKIHYNRFKSGNLCMLTITITIASAFSSCICGFSLKNVFMTDSRFSFSSSGKPQNTRL